MRAKLVCTSVTDVMEGPPEIETGKPTKSAERVVLSAHHGEGASGHANAHWARTGEDAEPPEATVTLKVSNPDAWGYFRTPTSPDERLAFYFVDIFETLKGS